jgi:flavin-dependent dehydrogenase
LCKSVSILGGGPAGASAAISALQNGASVQITEKSRFPRHKVCGEFFSPEIAGDLDRLGVWDRFLGAGPAQIRRMKLHFGRREKTSRLPEAAWGLSRFAFDALLFDRAVQLGAGTRRESSGAETVIAAGRYSSGLSRGRRLFGFKAHFEGPVEDAVELFFFDGCYVGVNAIEDGKTNVCGLGPEDYLRRFGFDFDEIIRRSPPLRERLKPTKRSIDWLSTGPLEFSQRFQADRVYRAGDALSFVDPFTGSGLMAAVKTGMLAGKAVTEGDPPAEYLAQCRLALKKPFEIAGILRKAVDNGWAEVLAGLIPGRLLFALTRPGK